MTMGDQPSPQQYPIHHENPFFSPISTRICVPEKPVCVRAKCSPQLGQTMD